MHAPGLDVAAATKGPMWGYPRPVLGAVDPLLEPFRGRSSPNIDNASEKLTLRYPHEGPWVGLRQSCVPLPRQEGTTLKKKLKPRLGSGLECLTCAVFTRQLFMGGCVGVPCRAHSAHISQSRPDSGLVTCAIFTRKRSGLGKP